MKKILNLGCGDDFYGTHRFDFVKTPATTEVGDLNGGLPYSDNYFDEVFCKSVIEHVLNLQIFVNEIHRVLKPGGRLFLRTDNAGYLPFHLLKSHEHNKIIAKGRAYSHKSDDDNHYHLFVESHLRALFKDFTNVKVRYTHGGRNLLNKILLSLLPKNMGKFHLDLYAIK